VWKSSGPFLLNKVRGLPCGHVFCGECIDGWFAINSATCPACRASTPGQKPFLIPAIDKVIEMLATHGLLPQEEVQKRKEKLAAAKAKKEEREATVKQAVNRGLDPQAILFASQQLGLVSNIPFLMCVS